MMKVNNITCFFILIVSILIGGCKNYLDAKPDKKLSTITSVSDLQGFLNDFKMLNQFCTPASAKAADNYYLPDAVFSSLSVILQKDYLWEPSTYPSYALKDWQQEYNIVYLANLVLDGLKKIDRTTENANSWDYCKGAALVYRAKSFFEIAQVWALAYDSHTAKEDLGIPLRLSPDFNIPSKRASNEETYAQIVNDLKRAIPYLPNAVRSVFSPSKPAAYGLLARTFLVMRKYKKARSYADSCLAINDKILDFNTLDASSASPFGPIRFTNPEDIMHSSTTSTSGLSLKSYYGRTDSSLYNTYAGNDLRKVIYFKTNDDGTHGFKAAYENQYKLYNGLATDELYLIKAECLARQGNVVDALKTLNKLLVNRFKTGTFVPYTANNKEDALRIVLLERRKELFYRMLRFSDIKRLNKEGANIILKRIIQGKSYTLKPNSSQYALAIPKKIIEITGMKQN